MTDPDKVASLTIDAGETRIIGRTCSLGRAPANDIVLNGDGASRRHALIHCQGEGEYWLVDLGSSNGTRLNDRYLVQPMRLNDSDRIRVGEHSLTFHVTTDTSAIDDSMLATTATVLDVRVKPCWLLVADIQDFTPLSQELSTEALAKTVGGWLSDSREVVETHQGAINQYLGDGYFAFWEERDGVLEWVASALEALKQMQSAQAPRFRLAVHHGPVTMGGSPSTSEVSMSGPQVNFVFRMEKLAGSLEVDCLMSEAAHTLLAPGKTGQSVGKHPLKGFPGEFAFFTP